MATPGPSDADGPSTDRARRLNDACRQLVNDWSAPDAGQERLRAGYLRHLTERPLDGWSRSCPGAHLTASSLICTADAGRVLLTLHRRIGRWLQTGGHLEPEDDSLTAAALREAREESGLSELRLDPRPLLLSRHQVRCGPVDPCFHLDVQFLALSEQDAVPIRSAESADLRWFPFDQHPGDASVVALVAAAGRRMAPYRS